MMEKIKNIYGAHPIPWTLGLLALVIALGALIFYYPAFSLEAAAVPVHACEPVVKGEEIPIGGVVTVAQQGGRTLEIDTENMILTLTDDATGITWSSAMEGAAADNLAAKALLQVFSLTPAQAVGKLLTLIPGMGAEALQQLKGSYRAVILQSFGVGGLPGGGSGALSQAMGAWLEDGHTIVMMTQVPYEGSDMAVYQVGQQVKEKYQLMEAYNMTLEAATAKLMWALGQTEDPKQIRELFCRPVQFDVIR